MPPLGIPQVSVSIDVGSEEKITKTIKSTRETTDGWQIFNETAGFEFDTPETTKKPETSTETIPIDPTSMPTHTTRQTTSQQATVQQTTVQQTTFQRTTSKTTALQSTTPKSTTRPTETTETPLSTPNTHQTTSQQTTFKQTNSETTVPQSTMSETRTQSKTTPEPTTTPSPTTMFAPTTAPTPAGIADVADALAAEGIDNSDKQLSLTLVWDKDCDLDIHAIQPDGSEIYYGNQGPLPSTGRLDVDNLGQVGSNGLAVENIAWTTAPAGNYRVAVANHGGCWPAVDYKLYLQIDEVTTIYEKTAPAGDSSTLVILSFSYGQNRRSINAAKIFIHDPITEELKSVLHTEFMKHLPSNATVELRIKCPVNRWDFGRSLVFSITTITTIGYGTWKPTRPASQIFCVIYASFGIPLFLCLVVIWTKLIKNFEYETTKNLKISVKIDLKSVSKVGSKFDSKFDSKVHSKDSLKNVVSVNDVIGEKPQTSTNKSVFSEIQGIYDGFAPKMSQKQIPQKQVPRKQVTPTAAPINENLRYSVFKTTIRVFTILLLYFVVPAVIIQKSEIHAGNIATGEKESGWGFGEALYYCFITLTTIGYGDYMTEGSDLESSVARILYFVYMVVSRILKTT